MNKAGRHLNISSIPGNRFLVRRYRFGCFCLLLFLALFCGSAAAATDVKKAPATSVGHGLSVAIADFDGDLRPDLASVQSGRIDAARANYLIQLQLTTAGRQSFQIVASIGGLQIAARDVNGDHAVDLILTTALLSQPVAILLNDGNGNFAWAVPSAFPGAFTESEANWSSGDHQLTDAVGVPPQSRTGIFVACGRSYLQVQAGSVPLSSSGRFLSPFLVSHLGRAPPSQVSHF